MNLTVSGIHSQKNLMTEKIVIIISGINESNSYNFYPRPFVKNDLAKGLIQLLSVT